MSDIVLRGTQVALDSDLGMAFVQDACRAGEGVITDTELSEKYELSPADWRAISKDRALERAVRAERERRVRSGQAVREAAAKHLVKGPGILDEIMSGPDSNPRHKIEAYKELRNTASVGADAEGRQESDRFIITINLGEGHVEHYDKELTIKPLNKEEHDGDER